MTIKHTKKLRDAKYNAISERKEQMNVAVAAQQRRARLMEVSLKVQTESMRVNAEFSKIEDAPNA